jgi:hypothetical protein
MFRPPRARAIRLPAGGAHPLSVSLLLAGFLALPGCAQEPPKEPTRLPAADLEDLWEQGVGFSEFLDGVEARSERWHSSYETGAVSRLNLRTSSAVESTFHLLVVAEDWCGDSAANIPFVARLVESMETVDLRIVDSTIGKGILESHPTPDGRAATPTILILDDQFNEVGCWIERPGSLQAWYQANKTEIPQQQLYGRLWAFYDADRGETTLAELIRFMQSAEDGRSTCGLAGAIPGS